MRPRGFICFMCGGEYFRASLQHHQKVCAARHHVKMEPCPQCEFLIPAPDLENHLKERCAKLLDTAPSVEDDESRKEVSRTTKLAMERSSSPMSNSKNNISAKVNIKKVNQTERRGNLATSHNIQKNHKPAKPSAIWNKPKYTQRHYAEKKILNSNVTSPDNPLLYSDTYSTVDNS